MNGSHRQATQTIHVNLPTYPLWVKTLLGERARSRPEFGSGGWSLRITESSDFTLLQAIHRDATALDDESLRLGVAHLYSLFGIMFRNEKLFPLRFWNYLPRIGQRSPQGLTRYEVFNTGRFKGYATWLGSGGFGKRLAAASAVGHRGDDLVVHALASRFSGTPVENPRQRPAYHYSKRYGPLPPCFSRATSLTGSFGQAQAPAAIIAGTASIVGEDSQHPGDLGRQLEEVHRNLACLAATIASDPSPFPPERAIDEDAFTRALDKYAELRVYVVNDAHIDSVIATFRERFPRIERLEVASADLCRSDLLVEVEGIVSSAL